MTTQKPIDAAQILYDAPSSSSAPSSPASSGGTLSAPAPTSRATRERTDTDKSSATDKSGPAGTMFPAVNAEAIYGRTRLVEDAINLRSPELFSTLQEDTATQAARRDLFTGIAKSTGLPQGVVVALAERAINDALSAARPRSDDEAAETAFNREQQIQRDNETVLAELRIRHGEKGAAELLSRTQRWVRSHPKLAEVLRENDRGSDLSIVRPIIDFVFTTGAGR